MLAAPIPSSAKTTALDPPKSSGNHGKRVRTSTEVVNPILVFRSFSSFSFENE